jgi:hypothetical protein
MRLHLRLAGTTSYYCLLYQASYMSLARVRVIRVVDLGHCAHQNISSDGGVGWGSGAQEAPPTARLHWIYHRY